MKRMSLLVAVFAMSLMGVADASSVHKPNLSSTHSIRVFQHRHHLKADGTLGHQTALALRGHFRAARKAHPGPLTAADRAYLGLPAPAPVQTPVAASAASYAPTAVASSAPSAPSAGGYCGAYQFDQQTWQSVGMSGSACGASPAQQDEAARRLMAQRGNEPWPNCGAKRGTYDLAAIRQCENGGHY